MMSRILIIGGRGQVGRDLARALALRHGPHNVVVSDLQEQQPMVRGTGFEPLDVLDTDALARVVKQHGIQQIYLLAALLSASGESEPARAWQLNMQGLLNVLELAACDRLRVFWPSSIAIFGPGSPRRDAPEQAPADPTTVYGISKLAGELWCDWYRMRRNVDVRSLRYPGLISHSALPGGGTTDYAVEVFHAAIERRPYICFLAADTRLPMMYMPDAVRATLELMSAPADALRRTTYNLASMSFTPADIVQQIQLSAPTFEVKYVPDGRQVIAASWPDSIDDTHARIDWGWRPRYDLPNMVQDMLARLAEGRRQAATASTAVG